MDKNKKYRAWYVINPPNKPTFIDVNSPEEGYKFLDEEIHRQLQDDTIWGNAFGLVVFEDGEWTEWYDEYGLDVFEAFEPVDL
jgi:hypothetical protein